MRLPILLMGAFLVIASSCDKDDDYGLEKVPVLSNTEVTEITTNTATSVGNIIDDGGTTVTVRGVCWNKNQNPTIDDNKTEDGTGAGSFTSSIINLEPNTTYYLKAYATNSAGTGYSSSLSFTTNEGMKGSSFTDPRDGTVYQTVVIGNQEWMVENLAYASPSGNYWAYDNDDSNVETYGYLYDFQTAREVCPTGWHLPTDEEWSELTNYLADNVGGKLKATGTIELGQGLWNDPNTGATNETGFTALAGGYRYTNGEFMHINNFGFWWSATEYDADFAWIVGMLYNYNTVSRSYRRTQLGFSVRCVKD